MTRARLSPGARMISRRMTQQQPALHSQGQHLPPQSVHLHGVAAVALKAKAATAIIANKNVFISIGFHSGCIQ